MSSMINPDMKAELNISVKGSVGALAGTNGQYAFRVVLSGGSGETAYRTQSSDLVMIITATPYMSDENAQNVLTLELAADCWVQKDSHWYWFKTDGIMAHSEWVSYMGHWYYLNAGGDMITGWLFWNEHWYYLKPDGIMAADEMTQDGYKIGPDGTWIQ